MINYWLDEHGKEQKQPFEIPMPKIPDFPTIIIPDIEIPKIAIEIPPMIFAQPAIPGSPMPPIPEPVTTVVTPPPIVSDVVPTIELQPLVKETYSKFRHRCGPSVHEKPNHAQIDLDMIYVGKETKSAYVRDVSILNLPAAESGWIENGEPVEIRLNFEIVGGLGLGSNMGCGYVKLGNSSHNLFEWLENYKEESPFYDKRIIETKDEYKESRIVTLALEAIYSIENFDELTPKHRKAQSLIWDWDANGELNNLWLMRGAYIDGWADRVVGMEKQFDISIKYDTLQKCPGPWSKKRKAVKAIENR